MGGTHCRLYAEHETENPKTSENERVCRQENDDGRGDDRHTGTYCHTHSHMDVGRAAAHDHPATLGRKAWLKVVIELELL